MRVKFAAKQLEESLRQIGAVVDVNSKLNIYTYGRLTVKDGVATITGHALGASLATRVPFKEATAGDSTFTFKAVQDVISQIGVEEVIIDAPDGTSYVQITGVGTNFVAQAKREELSKYPSAPEESFSGIAALGLPGIKGEIPKVIFAVPSEDGKYTVTTALLHATDKKLNFVATDGHRLALATLDCDPGSEFRIQMPKTALELASILEGDTVVAISESGSSANDGAFLFTTGKKTAEDAPIESLTVRKSSGSFPPYERVFENTTTKKGALSIKQADFLASILRLLPMADSELPIVILAYSAGTKTLSLKAVSDAYGFAYDSIPVEPTGDAATFSFESKINASFLKDFLEHSTGEITFFVPAANEAPLYLQNGPNYKYIMAPVVIPTAAAAPAPKAAPKAKAAKAAA